MRSSPARRLLACAVAAVAVLPLAGSAQAAPLPPEVPGEIAVPAGHKPFLLAHATGVQIYTCESAPGGYAWSPATPLAVLSDDRGRTIGSHYGGPEWRATDGSSVLGSRVNGASVDPTAIDWLLIKKDVATAGPDGDRLAGTEYIQRINTVGGRKPPGAYCNDDTLYTSREVPYTADYLFWKERSA